MVSTEEGNSLNRLLGWVVIGYTAVIPSQKLTANLTLPQVSVSVSLISMGD